ncbi:MAG TPA: FAD-binding oxidoreductase [Methylomirabilota bacterium]|jgi:sarcosine oxidase subunit beta|nr:FAD-binding oxidoreductase [Methylomirabilota bacterium]
MRTADVVIIGAGIMGVSAAYHLARRRAGRIVVLERGAVCSGSTALASGGIRHQYVSRVGIELTRQSIVTFENFEREFGVDPQFRQHGYLILVTTEAERDQAERSVALQRSLGVDVRLLASDEVGRQFPYLRADDLRGATYSPRDGYADPYLACTAMAARARELGVTIETDREVLAIERGADGVHAVTTAAGSVSSRAVVIAAGAWSGLVGRLAGVDIPVSPHRRSKFITAPFPEDRIPAATPFVIDPHQGISLRREGPGILLGGGRRHEPSAFGTEPDPALAEHVVARAVHRAPALGDARLVRSWVGLYEMTPDQSGIVSAVAGVEGLYVLAGFSGHGFMHGPIAGQLMAELITERRTTTVDIAPLSLERFRSGRTTPEPLTFV